MANTLIQMHNRMHDHYNTQRYKTYLKHHLVLICKTVVDSTNQVQAFHEPPSLRPHCSSAQQWITPELGLSSTPRQGILARLRLQGKQHLESGRILPRMPSYAHYYQTLIPHMPVPPGSIHLHKHSPSVLTSLSGSRQQAGSGSLRA
jgi:hypothetical protein